MIILLLLQVPLLLPLLIPLLLPLLLPMFLLVGRRSLDEPSCDPQKGQVSLSLDHSSELCIL